MFTGSEAVVGLFHVISKRAWGRDVVFHGHILSGEGWRFILSPSSGMSWRGFKQGSQAGSKGTLPPCQLLFSALGWFILICVQSVTGSIHGVPLSLYCFTVLRLGQGHTLSPKACNWGPSSPQLLINSVQLHPQILSLHSWVQGLGYQGRRFPVLTDLGPATSNLSLMVFPSRTHRDSQPSLLWAIVFFQNPKGLAPYLGFQNLRLLLRGNELPSFIPPMFSERFLRARLWSYGVYSREQNRKKQSLP